jgi:hypothetical protein
VASDVASLFRTTTGTRGIEGASSGCLAVPEVSLSVERGDCLRLCGRLRGTLVVGAEHRVALTRAARDALSATVKNEVAAGTDEPRSVVVNLYPAVSAATFDPSAVGIVFSLNLEVV